MKSSSRDHITYFLSCDWGTTSFRLKLADADSGKVLGVVTSSRGIKKMHSACSGEDRSQDKELYYCEYLRDSISKLEHKSGKDLQGVPLLISGMASSTIGLKELSYASLPLSLEQPNLQLEKRLQTEDFPHDFILISGISAGNDVMRGEETQVLGLAAEHNLKNGICILPGTHSKHIFIHHNAVTHFKTCLTGELFELLSNKSILKKSVAVPKETVSRDAFQKGVQKSLKDHILHALFEIRSNHILHKTDREDNYEFLSGLLIGAELKELREHASQPIYLAGSRRLQTYYSAALAFLELDHHLINQPDDLTVRGHRVILDNLDFGQEKVI